MYPYLLIRKYNCTKDTNWVTPGKVPLAAAKPHKLGSVAISTVVLLVHKSKFQSMTDQYQMQQLSEIQADPQCLKTATDCFILKESLLSHLSTVFPTKPGLQSCESQQQNYSVSKGVCLHTSITHPHGSDFGLNTSLTKYVMHFQSVKVLKAHNKYTVHSLVQKKVVLAELYQKGI